MPFVLSYLRNHLRDLKYFNGNVDTVTEYISVVVTHTHRSDGCVIYIISETRYVIIDVRACEITTVKKAKWDNCQSMSEYQLF